MPESMFSVSALHSVGGASLAILLVVEWIKDIPGLRRLPTRWLAMMVGELLLFCSSPVPTSPAAWLIEALNGLLSASAAIGSWHFICNPPPLDNHSSQFGR